MSRPRQDRGSTSPVQVDGDLGPGQSVALVGADFGRHEDRAAVADERAQAVDVGRRGSPSAQRSRTIAPDCPSMPAPPPATGIAPSSGGHSLAGRELSGTPPAPPMRLQKPQEVRLAREQMLPEVLAVAVVEFNPRDAAPEGASSQPPEHQQQRVVQPEQRVGPTPADVADRAVVAVGDPAAVGGSASAARSRNSSRSAAAQPASQYKASSSTCGTPSRRANSTARVLLPDPVLPVTAIRCIGVRRFPAMSLIHRPTYWSCST